jgi:hypothetical protein
LGIDGFFEYGTLYFPVTGGGNDSFPALPVTSWEVLNYVASIFLGGVSYEYSTTLFSVSVTNSEFTYGSMSSEIIQVQSKCRKFGGFEETPLENCCSVEATKGVSLYRTASNEPLRVKIIRTITPVGERKKAKKR